LAANLSQDPAGVPFDEDEDLFDFPIVEMTLEGLQERSSTNPQPRTMPVEPVPPPALPKPASKPQAAPTLSSQPPAPLPAPAPAPKPPAAKPAPKVEARPAPAPVLASLAAVPPREDEVAEPMPPARASRRWRMRGMRIAVVLLIVTNAGAFWFLWRTHSAFGAGLKDLRAEIDTAAKRLERARRDVNDRGTSYVAGGSESLEAVDALERTAIQLATDEIRAGEYGAARRRLSRLLARAEHMSPGLRAEVEPRAAYLIAQSYHDEALARSGAKH
jgi:hypothetical protein